MNQLSSPSVKRAIIMGATSGIGYETARLLLAEGWHLGIAGRREKELQILQAQAPERVWTRIIDIRLPHAGE